MFVTVNESLNAYACHVVHFVAEFMQSRTFGPSLFKQSSLIQDLERMFKQSKEPVPVPDYYCAQNIDHKEVKYKLYQDDIIGPKCFLFAKSGGGTDIQKATWEDARKFCTDFGGDIVSIHSFEQNSFIVSHLKDETYWIGFGKEISSGAKPSKWVDGTDVDFDGWKDGALRLVSI